jgi:hypothetical protein
MIYLVKSNDKLKIGYTSNFAERIKGYKSHNPDIEIINYKIGSREDEKILHDTLKELIIVGEWYLYSEYIIDVFEKYVPNEKSLKVENIKLKEKILQLTSYKKVEKLEKSTSRIILENIIDFYEIDLNEFKDSDEVIITFEDKILYHRLNNNYIINIKRKV